MTCMAAPQTALAQDVEDKPSQILPDSLDERPLPTSQTKDRKSPQITSEIDLDDFGVKPSGSSAFTIGAVQVEGAKALPRFIYADIIENFVGRSASPAELKELTKALAGRARQQGYIFASAMVPAQSAKLGVVQVRIDPGVIDRVRVSGTDNRIVQRVFNDLEGRPAVKTDIERAALVSGDVRGLTISRIRFSRNKGRGVLNVVAEETPDAIYISADNHGSNTLGPVRSRIVTEMNAVLSDGDMLDTQILFTPIDPDELTFISARYSSMLNDIGSFAAVNIAAGRTWQQQKDGEFSKSRSRYVSFKTGAPLHRTRAADIWVNLDMAYLAVDRNFSDGRIREDRIATVTASATGAFKFAGGQLFSGLSIIRGLDILGATQGNDPISSRRDGSGQFTKSEMWLTWNRKLGQGYSLRARASGQLASRPLLSPQEIDIGGPRFGRGFNYSERSGDQGVLGSFELRKYSSKPAKGVSWAQLYVFADGGFVDNLRGGRGGGSLMSAGGGVRAGLDKFELGLEAAVPVKGARDNRHRSPQLNIVLSLAL